MGDFLKNYFNIMFFFLYIYMFVLLQKSWINSNLLWMTTPKGRLKFVHIFSIQNCNVEIFNIQK